jgi:LmbE family N-acetylglucosaminyl deacetylase
MSDTNYYTPKVVLAVGAHADDIDITASGSLLRWADEGADIYYLLLTDGSRGSSDAAATPDSVAAHRQADQKAAAKLVGAKDVFFLDYTDGCLEVTQDLKRDIVRAIRRVKPDTVITMDPTFLFSTERGMINHPDHRAAGQATLDAVYPLARDRLSFPEVAADEGLAPHKVQHVLLTNFEHQNFLVDISQQFERKLDVVAAHASQFPDREQISGFLKQQAETLAAKTGSQYAEGFVRIDLAF